MQDGIECGCNDGYHLEGNSTCLFTGSATLYIALQNDRNAGQIRSYDLHTKDSGLDHTDPNFVEAFQRETEILGKRVAACQAHVVLTTCFVEEELGDFMLSMLTK